MSIKSLPALIVVRSVTEAKPVKLLSMATACDVDGKQNWPGETAADKAQENQNAKESQEEVGFQRAVAQDELVVDP